MTKLILAIAIISASLGCSQTHETHSHTGTGTPGEPAPTSSKTQILKTFSSDENPRRNVINAVNVTDLHPHFDFEFIPSADQQISLPFSQVKSGPFIGCDSSDIDIRFNLYKLNPDGAIDFSANQAMGPQPVAVSAGQPYVVRIALNLKKSCLGIHYDFVVQSFY